MKQLQQEADSQGEEMIIREGGNHTVVTIGGNRTAVPRHREVDDLLAKLIMKQIKGEAK